tara:strand:+ start:85 stop:405 length:321 start_codon:yes stop_codon:yes gene_type:complete
MVIIVIILIISIIFLSYALKVALDRITFFEEFILKLDLIINDCSNKLDVIDNSGHFESDDEIGFVFNEIKDIQNLLDNLFEKDNDNEKVDRQKDPNTTEEEETEKE